MIRTRSLQARLALLYIGPFILSGAVLLSVPLLQVDRSQSVPVGQPGGSGPPAGTGTGIDALLTVSAIALSAMAVLAIGFGWLVAGRFLRPLRTITSAARDISATNLDRRLGPMGRNDEFTELAATLDDLFSRLHATFGSQRHFVANAAHELRTPLTAQRTLLQVALADPEASTETLRAACAEVLTLGAAQAHLIDSLLTLATSEQGIEKRELFDLAEVAESVVLEREEEARRRGLTVTMTLTSAPVAGEVKLVESLVINLVDNAIRYNLPGGTIEIHTAASERPSITVRNTGPVLTAAQVTQALQPFRRVSTRRIRQADGHGLGLAIVQAIAKAHDAELSAHARPEGGLDIEISFPRPGGCG